MLLVDCFEHNSGNLGINERAKTKKKQKLETTALPYQSVSKVVKLCMSLRGLVVSMNLKTKRYK